MKDMLEVGTISPSQSHGVMELCWCARDFVNTEVALQNPGCFMKSLQREGFTHTEEVLYKHTYTSVHNLVFFLQIQGVLLEGPI